MQILGKPKKDTKTTWSFQDIVNQRNTIGVNLRFSINRPHIGVDPRNARTVGVQVKTVVAHAYIYGERDGEARLESKGDVNVGEVERQKSIF